MAGAACPAVLCGMCGGTFLLPSHRLIRPLEGTGVLEVRAENLGGLMATRVVPNGLGRTLIWNMEGLLAAITDESNSQLSGECKGL